MTLDIGNTDKLNLFRAGAGPARHRAAAARHQPVGGRFRRRARPQDGEPAIRYALAAVKGVAAQAMREVIVEREADGAFRDLFDFARRLDHAQLQQAAAREPDRGRRLRRLEPQPGADLRRGRSCYCARRAAPPSDRASQQASLFAGIDSGFAERPSLPVVEDWPPVEKLQHEFEAIGFYLSAHPLDPYGNSLERAGMVRFADLPAGAGGRRNLRASSSPASSSASRSAPRRAATALPSSSFRTPAACIEVTVFSELLAAGPRAARGRHSRCCVTVDVSERGAEPPPHRPGDRAARQAAAHAAPGSRSSSTPRRRWRGLKLIQREAAGGRGRVTLVLDLDRDSEVELALPGGLRDRPAHPRRDQGASRDRRRPGYLSGRASTSSVLQQVHLLRQRRKGLPIGRLSRLYLRHV